MTRTVRIVLVLALLMGGCPSQIPPPDDSDVCTEAPRPFVFVNDNDDDGDGTSDLAQFGTPDADLLPLALVEAFDLPSRDDVTSFRVSWVPATGVRIWADENRAMMLGNGQETPWSNNVPTIWVEGLESGTVQFTLTTTVASSIETSRDLQLDVIDMDVLRADDSEVRSLVSLFHPEPVIGIPDVTPDQVAGDRFLIPKNECIVRDVITFVTSVEFFNSDEGDMGWRELPITDAPPPNAFGNPYQSTFASSFVMTNLDDLRQRPLGTRRRYLFRTTNAIGRSAYEELILEVRWDAVIGERYLEPMNRMGPPSVADPFIPGFARHRLILNAPSSMAGFALFLDENTPYFSAGFPDGTSEIGGIQLQDPIEFVVLEGAALTLRTAIPQRHFIPHFRRRAGAAAIGATFGPGDAPACARRAVDVAATDYGLDVSLTDDDIEAIVPVTVRYAGGAEDVTASNMERDKFLMRPFHLSMLDLPDAFASESQSGTVVRLDVEGDPNVVRIWSRSSANEGGWQPLDLPAEFVIGSRDAVGETVTAAYLDQLRFLIEGREPDGEAALLLSVRDGDSLVGEDRVRLIIRDFTGVAGQRLDQFPHIRYTQTFNEQNDAGIADTIAAALDPALWPHLTAHYSLDAPPVANVQVVPHRSSNDWAADNALEGSAARLVRLDGETIASSVYDIGQIAKVGAYDVVFDLVNASGQPVSNGRLDPGDIIGVLTDDEVSAEVHVVADPLGPAVLTPHVGWIEYGSVDNIADRFTIPAGTDENPGDVTNNFIHGLIYYPAAEESGPAVAAADGAFPLVVLLHGNHAPLRWLAGLVESGALTADQADAITGAENYEGFVYLQQFLATKGYASVSVDLDRYFGSAPPFDWPGEAIRARAFCAVMNIDRVRALNQPDSGSPISQRIDVNDITLLGHSKGGESVVECCEYRGGNDNASPTGPFAQVAPFPISRVISVAPARKHDGTVGDRPHLILHGAADGDEWPASGFRHYDKATGRKAMLFIDGANHNFFNASWPYSDATQKPNNDTGDIDPMTPPIGDPATLTDRSYQQDLLKAYVYAWLQGDTYLAYFSRVPERIRPPTLAPRSIHQQYRDWPANTMVWDDFETEVAIDTSSSGGTASGSGFDVFRERLLSDRDDHYYNDTNAVELAWDVNQGIAVYAQFPPAETADASAYRFLTFRVGPYFEEKSPLALTVELRDVNGGVVYANTAAVSPIGVPYNATGIALPAPLFAPADMTRTMFRTFRLDLRALQVDGRQVDLTQIISIRFVFDQPMSNGTTGRVVIDDIEFTD